MSSIAKFVKDRIAELPVDEVFTYDSFGQTALVERRAVAKALSRLVKSGEVEVLCRGQFYKPAKCKYGSLGLAEEKQIRSLLRGGYVSGAEAFNRIGLTTQVPSVIEIAYPGVPYRKKVGSLKIQYIRSCVDKMPKNTELLVLLDALKEIGKIQDASPKRVATFVADKIKKFNYSEINELIQLARSYRPRVRALLGAILESCGLERQSRELLATLNPLSSYSIGVKDLLPNLKKWGFR
jgi:hypothetical protein